MIATPDEMREMLRETHVLLAFLEKALRPPMGERRLGTDDIYAAATWLHIQKQRRAIGELLSRKDEPEPDTNDIPELSLEWFEDTKLTQPGKLFSPEPPPPGPFQLSLVRE